MFLLLLSSCVRPTAAPPAVEDGFRVLIHGHPATLPPGVTVTRRLEDRGLLAARVADAAARRALKATPGVLSVEDERRFQPALSEGLSFLGQPEVEASGHTAVGATVILLDTGADPGAFGCAAAGDPDCPLVELVEIAPEDGSADDDGHGTLMTTIVHAVAPGAELVVLDVFDTDGLAWESDLFAADDWLMAHVDISSATIIDLSFTEVDPGAICGTPFAYPSLDGPQILHVQPADVTSCSFNLAAGSVYPADVGRVETAHCVDEVTGPDQIACFSPQEHVNFYLPGTVTTDVGEVLTGNSIAAAYLAGSAAVVLASDPELWHWDAVDRLADFGVPLDEPVTPWDDMVPRVDLAAAVEHCARSNDTPDLDYRGGTYNSTVIAPDGCSWSLTPEVGWLTVSPTSGVGPATLTWTATANDTGARRCGSMDETGWSEPNPVHDHLCQDGGPFGTLRLQSTTGTTATPVAAINVLLASPPATSVCVSETTTCTDWRPMVSSLPWTLTGATGTKRLYAIFEDAGGVRSAQVTSTIVWDTTLPRDGTVTAVGLTTGVDLRFSGFSDTPSGLDRYQVARATGSVAPATCAGGVTTSAYNTHLLVTGLTPNTTYAWRVCAIDRAGNTTTGATTSLTTRLEYVAPVGTVEAPVASKTTAITLTLSASDASGVARACVSNTVICSAWFPMTSSKAWTLTSGDGNKTVYAWFEDAHGNVSSTVSDTVVLDAVAPTGGTLTATGGDAFVDLSWSGIAESGSGVAEYRLASVVGTVPPSCGTAVWTGTETSVRRGGLVNGTTYAFRLCAVDAAGNVATGLTTTAKAAPEFDAPVGTVELNGGADWTKSTAVTATLVATDASGVAQACLSNTSTCTAWFPMVGTKTWTLTTGAGTRTVWAAFKDPWGNVGPVVSDTIGLDTTVPTGGTVTATGSAGQVALTFGGFSDTGSGVSGYRVAHAASISAPANCNTPTWSGSATATTLTGLVDGTTYAFRVCAVDLAGNVSAGVTTSARPAPEYVPPVGTLSLNSGADWTKSTAVTATLAATDDSAVSQACLSSTTTCTAWFPMAATKAWTLTAGSGTRTVYASYKDQYGNISTTVSDTIQLDTTLPTGGAVTASPSTGEVALSWSGFADAGSGLASYRVSQATGTTAPANCATPTWSGTATATTMGGLTDGTTYAFRVCAVDLAGNVSAGVTTSARPAPEYVGPTGAIVLNGGADWTTSTSVTTTLTADDPSGVSQVCLSNTTTCTAWITAVGSKTWTLTTGSGTRTVYATWKDVYGNVGATVSDSIGLDATAPTNGALTATGGAGQVDLAWTGFSDAGSGLSGYRFSQATGTTAPANCSTPTWTGTGAGTIVTGLTDGTTYAFRVCAVDLAGNVSTGVTATSRPAPEYDPPTGQVTIASGADWTRVTAVTLSLAATDASGVERMCLSTTTSCATWIAFAPTASLTLPGGDGTKTARVWYEDSYGNTAGPFSDDIGLDATAPTNGAVTTAATAGGATVSWSGFADTRSGIATYTLVTAPNTAPTRCTSGTVVWTGSGTSATLSGLTPGSVTGLRVCATDAAGNLSSGTTASVTAL